MEFFIACLKAFLVGGAFCVIGQLLIDKTRLTPARILTSYVVAGVILGAVGVYQPLADWAGAGACVPASAIRWRRACARPSPRAACSAPSRAA